MADAEHGGDFREYRKLILAHIESSNRRQDGIEDAITELKVQMGVLVVKVGLIVSLIVLIGGTVATLVVSNVVKLSAPAAVVQPSSGD